MLRLTVPGSVAAAPRPPLAGRCATLAPRRPARLQPAQAAPARAGNNISGGLASQLPPEALYLAAGVVGAAAVAAAAYFAWKNNQAAGDSQAVQAGAGGGKPMAAKREDAVLVVGSTGKLGRQLTLQLLEQGRCVVAAARSAQRAAEALTDVGLAPGQQPGGGLLAIEGGVDITDPVSLRRKELWAGVSQVAVAVGPLFGRQPDGQMGYTDNMTSERVDSEGVANLTEVAKQMLPSTSGRAAEQLVLPMASESDLAKWERLDDVIMGGQSSSRLEAAPDGSGAVWAGQLVLEGGGFCGARAKGLELSLAGFDGLALRLKGDGQTYKVNLKSADRGDDPESTYAATFGTSGEWQTVRIPWREFVPVIRARTDPGAPPLDPACVRQLGFRLSRFDFNNLANPAYRPGPFRLQLEGGIRAFTAPKPALVLLSSAAVERNALIGDDAASRKADIPIVQLNPGGILNHKYAGEMAVRASGLPYAVVRPVGLTTEQEDEPFELEASQGDRISGKISRAEAASMLAAALQTPAACGKTLEVRRWQSIAGQQRSSTPAELERLFLGAVEDWRRPQRGLLPLPAAVPPPPPPDQARVKEILADPQVQAAAQRQRDRGAAEKLEGRATAGRENDHTQAGDQSPQAEARAWINDWRARTLESKLPQEAEAGAKQ